MPEQRFYNSLTKKIEPFTSKEPGKVTMYNCGPTVYKRQHIGNMRRFLFADFLKRYLEMEGYEVRDITNITDVGHLTQDEIDAGEDKMEKAAREEKLTPQDIATKQTKLFMQDLAALNIQPANLYPKASQHVKEMIALIEKLIEKGHAYITKTGVYFSVESFPAYGKLSGNTLEQLAAGHRVKVRGEKKHPADFALWILDENHIQKWDSPWGVGYPGWHIECSAMSLEYLGSDIDLHTGGEDNKFPHHENEIAQSEGAMGQPFVRFWMHNSHLQFKGQKLAKSSGEQISIDTIKEKGFSPLAFRLLIFGSQYRTKAEFSWEALAAANENLASITHLLRRLKDVKAYEMSGRESEETIAKFKESLADDLNTPQALAVLLQYIKTSNTELDKDITQAPHILATLKELDEVLGIIEPVLKELEAETIPEEILNLSDQREEAKLAKKFEQADAIRSAIEAKGFTIEDTSNGPRLIPKGK